MKLNAKKQYTIRNVPRSVDQALRKKAARQRKSLNSVILEALIKDADVGTESKVYDDLDRLIGSWISDPEMERAFKEQREIDPRDWK